MPSATTILPPVANGVAALEFARRMTLGLAEDIPQDQETFQPVPGANHLLWILGHLAVTDAMMLSHLAGVAPSCPEPWQPLFGMGSEPAADASAYPPRAELLRVMAQLREDLLAWFKGMDETQLAAPLPKDWEGFAPTHGALMSTLAAHETLHGGQLTTIRKALGLPRRFG